MCCQNQGREKARSQAESVQEAEEGEPHGCLVIATKKSLLVQRLRAEAKLDRDLQEASAVESKEKRTKIVRITFPTLT